MTRQDRQEKLFRAIGYVGDDLIQRADAPAQAERKQPAVWIKWAALAACCALVIGLASRLPIFQAKSSAPETATMTMETTTQEAPAEEEKALLARMADGDPAARDALITHNLRLVVYLAKKYEGSGVPSEDMVSIGTIGLIKAVNTFTPERSIKLATYASRCIGNEILMYLRKSSNRRQEASIDEPLNIDGDGNELLLSDVLSSEENQVGQRLEQDAERASLRRSVEQLSPRERQIMELRFGLLDGVERTQKEVADAIGISQSYISRLEKRIIRQLREQLGD